LLAQSTLFYDAYPSCSLFEIHEPSKKVFGIDEGPRVFEARCQAHAKSLVLLVDGVFQMLTNCPEQMDQVFQQLGAKHAQAGVHPGLFPHMGAAIAHTLQTFMEEELNEDEVMAWGQVYGALAFEICQHIHMDEVDDDDDDDEEDVDMEGLSQGMGAVSIDQ